MNWDPDDPHFSYICDREPAYNGNFDPLQFRYGRFKAFVDAEWMDFRTYSIRFEKAY
jgi:hypothetical protein